METYTPAEQEKLLKFREILSDALLTEKQQDDAYLIRWLRAQDLDLKKAKQMLKNHIEWRKNYNVDGILEEEELEDMCMASPGAWCGTTPEGYPILLSPHGGPDARIFLEKYGKDVCHRFLIRCMEKIERKLDEESRRQNRRITQIVQIQDAERLHVSYRQIMNKAYRQMLLENQEIFNTHYPQLVRLIVVVNASKPQALLFGLVKTYISKRNLETIEVHGPDKEKWRKAIAQKFPGEKIPKYWGGTLEGKDEFCSGHDIWFQGPQDMAAHMEVKCSR